MLVLYHFVFFVCYCIVPYHSSRLVVNVCPSLMSHQHCLSALLTNKFIYLFFHYSNYFTAPYFICYHFHLITIGISHFADYFISSWISRFIAITSRPGNVRVILIFILYRHLSFPRCQCIYQSILCTPAEC